MNLRIISAGAGSGKTFRLTKEMVQLLEDGLRAGGIIATTFTNKAAAELQERVRVRLLEQGMTQQADDLSNALIGTVHSLGVKLLQRFAFEAGVPPGVTILADEDQQVMFNQALAMVLTPERVETMENLCELLGLSKKEAYDWRREVRMVTEIARSNDLDAQVLSESKQKSWESFARFLPPLTTTPQADLSKQLSALLEETILLLEGSEDDTVKTRKVVETLKEMRNQLKWQGQLPWHQWVKIGKLDPSVRNRDTIQPLQGFAGTHDALPEFQHNIRLFIDTVFDLAIAALVEYDRYKKQRGLIDYVDMELQIVKLLDLPAVREVLKDEIDLLMVDEFQDTSPIQLEIFLKLTRIVPHAIWVGDPKQSIYGFRGADPRIMQAIIAHSGGIQPEDIQGHSWRSREDLVNAANAIFVKAFDQLPPEQIVLQPKRCKLAGPACSNKQNEPLEMGDALVHWHFRPEEPSGRKPTREWVEHSIARSLRQWLDRGWLIFPKGGKAPRHARPGDVAILCRTNAQCQAMAEALHHAGLQAVIARSGLLDTAEARLILACLKYLLNRYDTLSVAEILVLGAGLPAEQILEDRLNYLDQPSELRSSWAIDQPLVRQLSGLRQKIGELSGTEILDVLLEELDLRRIMLRWGKGRQRLENVDMLRKMTAQYEEACNRLHSAASLGGLLLWLNEQAQRRADAQASGESPDAVNIMTYHKSKGLEWPVVICHSLDQDLRADAWGAHLMDDREEVDLQHLLDGRWLRYWVNPYGDQYRGTALVERLEESDLLAQVKRRAAEEEVRLLYVGLTRARDFLVFPTSGTAPGWLQRVCGTDAPMLLEDSPETFWQWNGQFLPKQTEIFSYPKLFPQLEVTEADPLYFAARSGRQAHVPYQIDPATEPPGWQHGQVAWKTAVKYASALEPEDESSRYPMAKAFKALLAAWPDAQRHLQQTAATLLANFEVEASAEVLMIQAKAFESWRQQQFPQHRDQRKLPLHHLRDGRSFDNILDLVLERDGVFHIIQHSAHTGDPHKLPRAKMAELESWMELAASGVREVYAATAVHCYWHFVLWGTVVELQLVPKAASLEQGQLKLF